MPLRIGVNALYLIPGGVGGTEVYLRNLLRAAALVDGANEWIDLHESRDRGSGSRRAEFHGGSPARRGEESSVAHSVGADWLARGGPAAPH